MLGVLRQNQFSLPIFCSDTNPTHLRSSPDLTLFPTRTPFNLSSLIFTSTILPSALPKASLPEPSQDKDNSRFFSLLLSYGFSDEQIQALVSKRPRILLLRPETTIKSKFDYLLSFGFSTDELIHLVLSDTNLLCYSLKNRIIPNLNFLLNLLGSKELVKKALARHSILIHWNVETYIKPNMETLRANGVPIRQIIVILLSFAQIIVHKPDAIADLVKEHRKLGINPSSRAFIVAIATKITMSRHVWDKKVQLYRSFGWSDANFMAAFTKVPQCMMNSEAKIKKMMEFYVNKLGWDPVFLSEQPVFIGLSLESRVIPRCAVLDILASRRLLGGEMKLYRVFLLNQSLFEAKYVSNYKESIPAVIEAYQTRQEGKFSALRSWQERTKQKATLARKVPMPASSSK